MNCASLFLRGGRFGGGGAIHVVWVKSVSGIFRVHVRASLFSSQTMRICECLSWSRNASSGTHTILAHHRNRDADMRCVCGIRPASINERRSERSEVVCTK